MARSANSALARVQVVNADGDHHIPGVDPQRLLGRYYTPDRLAEILVEWALTDVVGPVLDPSYGGCAFLNAGARVLSQKGIENPGRLLYGVDVDSRCADAARSSGSLVTANCITGDFLGTSPTDFPGVPFAAIVGNPPYVRHHWLKGRQRETARATVANSAVPLRATASMWAYFLIHALKFLRRRGRLAMLVPEAILQAQYAVPLRRALSDRFGRTLLVHIRDRLFDGTDEAVVVVAASEYGEPGRLSIDAIDGPDDLAPLLGDSENPPQPDVALVNGRRTTRQVLRLLEDVERKDAVTQLAEFAEIRIGFVTGANRYFIRNHSDLDKLNLPGDAVHPVVCRTKWLAGLDFTQDDHSALAAAGDAAFLVSPADSHRDTLAVQQWMADGVDNGFHHRTKCAARPHWFQVALPPAPDAFATCSRLGAPRLVLNRTQYRCSNTLHSVRWKPSAAVVPEAIALGFLTTTVGVWAELFGRRYGGGVLKIEPGTLNKMPVPVVPGAEDAFGEADRLLRAGLEEDARKLADHRILCEGLGLSSTQRRALVEAHSQLVSQRRPVRHGG